MLQQATHFHASGATRTPLIGKMRSSQSRPPLRQQRSIHIQRFPQQWQIPIWFDAQLHPLSNRNAFAGRASYVWGFRELPAHGCSPMTSIFSSSLFTNVAPNLRLVDNAESLSVATKDVRSLFTSKAGWPHIATHPARENDPRPVC